MIKIWREINIIKRFIPCLIVRKEELGLVFIKPIDFFTATQFMSRKILKVWIDLTLNNKYMYNIYIYIYI